MRLERWFSHHKCVQNNTNTPRIHLETMSIRHIEQHLRRNIVRRSTDRLLPLPGTLDQRREPEIADLNVHVRVEEKVAELQVTVDDLVFVHVVAGADELDHEEAGFWLAEFASRAEHVGEGAHGAEAEGHVDVGFVFEDVMKFDDVGVLEGAVDLDLGVKLEGQKHQDGVGGIGVPECSWMKDRKRQTLVLAFLVLSESFVTTLHANRLARTS